LKTYKKKHLNYFFFILVLQIAILPSNLFAFHTDKRPVEYILNIWTVEDGLPQNTIQALLQTADGFIWIGTPSGLVRFDGLNFKKYTRWDIPGLEDDNITCLYEDYNKVLWVGTEDGGLCTLKDGRWYHYSMNDGLSSNRIRAISGDFEGSVWIGTDYGLNRLKGNEIEVYTEKDGLYDNTITALTIDNWNNLWIGTFRGGVAKFDNGHISVYGYQEGLKNLSIRTLFAGAKGFLWIGTLQGIYYIKRKEDIVHQVKGTSYTPVNTILENSMDELLIGTMVAGVKRMNSTTLERQPLKNILPDEFIHCAIKDDADNIWLGTDRGGLVQLKPRRIFNISSGQVLPKYTTTAVLKDRYGSIWIGTKNRGLNKVEQDSSWQIYTTSSGLSSNRIKVLYEDMDGYLWIGTDDGGVNVLNKSRLNSKLSIKNGLSSNCIKAILQDDRGTIWIGTDKGLNSYANGRVQNYHAQQKPEINVLLESKSKILYAGTNKGVFQLIGNSLKPLIQNFPSQAKVLSLYEDDENALWIGTNGDGLFRWYDGKFDVITKKDGLHDNYILSIAEDEKNNLWMSSHSGVFIISQKNISGFLNDKTGIIHSTWYNESEGMASRQCVGDGQPSVFKTKDGRWLYPTVKGVSIVDPNFLTDYCTVPRIHMEYIYSTEDTVKTAAENIQELDGDMIKIGFTAIEFAAPDKISFKYKLEGHDRNFRYLKLNNDRTVTYHNLTFGEYTFQLLAANNELKWNEEAATILFEIKPPFYLTPSFIIIVVGIGITISSVLVYRNHQRKRKNRQNKYKTSHLDLSKLEDHVQTLESIMVRDKLFLDPDLTLADLASRLKLHSNHISRIINEQFGMSFNDYINKYRIEEVQKRLINPQYADKTVLEIMYETGFYSKSVFNTAFKKFTGMTPSEYRKQNT
jgi:ligand-binding sensor domain-containing protein/AraC-like DNA-binding protein